MPVTSAIGNIMDHADFMSGAWACNCLVVQYTILQTVGVTSWDHGWDHEDTATVDWKIWLMYHDVAVQVEQAWQGNIRGTHRWICLHRGCTREPTGCVSHYSLSI